MLNVLSYLHLSEGEGEEGEGGGEEDENDDEGESKIPAVELGLAELKAIQSALEKEAKEGGVGLNYS